jgi:hypothetical protein
MYLHRTTRGAQLASEAAQRPPLGPGFSAEQIAQAGSDGYMEIWASSFNDAGKDSTRFCLYDKGSQLIAAQTIDGY